MVFLKKGRGHAYVSFLSGPELASLLSLFSTIYKHGPMNTCWIVCQREIKKGKRRKKNKKSWECQTKGKYRGGEEGSTPALLQTVSFIFIEALVPKAV